MTATNTLDWTQTTPAGVHVEIRDGVETYYAVLPDDMTADDAADSFVETYTFSRLDDRDAGDE